MLDDELRSQQTKCDHCLECGIQILEKTPADSEHAADINNRLDSLSNNWNNLESLIKVLLLLGTVAQCPHTRTML